MDARLESGAISEKDIAHLEKLARALPQWDATSKVTGQLLGLKSATSSTDQRDALETLRATVDRLVERDPLHLLRYAIRDVRERMRPSEAAEAAERTEARATRRSGGTETIGGDQNSD